MITAVLTLWKRPEEIKLIKQKLKSYKFINQVLVRDNTENNLMSWGKYPLISYAKNDTIYVQDDDCYLENIDELYKIYDGTCMVNAIKPSHIGLYSGRDSMMGWGAIFNKEWVDLFKPYVFKYGIDDVLKREADRILTCLVKHKTIVGEINDFPSAEADYALYKQPDHESYKQEALRRVTELG